MRFDKRESKKAKSGYTWRVTFEYRDRYGVQRRYSKSGFPTKRAAEIHGREVQADLEKGLDLKLKDKTVGEVFEMWKSTTKLAENTINNYSYVYRRFIEPVLANSRIADLHYPELQAFFDGLPPLGESDLSHTKSLLKDIGDMAIKSGIIDAFPIKLVEAVPTKEKPPRRQQYLSETDFRSLCAAVEMQGRTPWDGEVRKVFLFLAYFSGLRLAEICGMKWEDVDLERKEMHVWRQLVYSARRVANYEIKEDLKSKKSQSTLPIPAPLAKALQEWRAQNPYDLLICKEDGGFYSVPGFRGSIATTANRLGIDFRPHMLRHTYATNLVRSGVDPKTASELARHANPATTLKIYTETDQELKAQAEAAAFPDEEPAPNLQA